MANPPTPTTSGRGPRGTPRVSAEEARSNALLFLDDIVPPDAIIRLTAISARAVPEKPAEQCAAFAARIARPEHLYNVVPCPRSRLEFPGATLEAEFLLNEKTASAIPDLAPGGLIRANAVLGNGSGNLGCHRDQDIAAFDYLLIESDLLPLPLQAALLYRLIEQGFPVVSAVFTGGKSIHALVRILAKDAEAFRSISRRIYSRLVRLGFDPSTGNPSRMTRIPGCVRTFPDGSTSLQNLLYLA